jgi:hypothetical protein
MVNTDYPVISPADAGTAHNAGYGLGFRVRASAGEADTDASIRRWHR